MPHIVIEYSSNLLDSIEDTDILMQLHRAVGDLPSFNLGEIKSRFHRCETFLKGAGERVGAGVGSFVHITLSILAGRPLEVQQEAGRRLLMIMEEHCTRSIRDQGCDVSVEVREMRRETYTKRQPVSAAS